MTTYIYGNLTRSKFFTPYKTYNHKLIFPDKMKINTYLTCKLTNNEIEVFYNAPVFNSYLTVAEEEVYKIYSVDNKTTITRTQIKSNTLYVFRVIEETANLRICEIYNNDLLWPGRITSGKLTLKKRPLVITGLGKGECVLQNNKQAKNISVKLWKVENDQLSFVEINNPVQGVIEVEVDSVRENFVMVSKDNVRGIVFTQNEERVEERVNKREKKVLNVYVKEELLGFYIFAISNPLTLNSYIEAEIVEKTSESYLLKYETYTGFIKITNLDYEPSGNKIKGKIIKINNSTFELSSVIEKISVPFDLPDIEELISDDETDDTVSDILNLINLIKKLTENKKYKEVEETYYKYITSTQDKDNLSLVYSNFLQYAYKNDTPHILKELKKCVKFCSEKWIEKVGESSNLFEVVEFCYSKNKSKSLFKIYVDMCYEYKKTPPLDHIDIIIDALYKNNPNPRLEAEKVVGSSRLGWIRYIENEEINYKRVLYRRVVNMKWKVSEMKEWFRMWMTYEKEVGGNVEEVRNRAKSFVDSLKKV